MRTSGLPRPGVGAPGEWEDLDGDGVANLDDFARRLGGEPAADPFGLYQDLADAIAEDAGPGDLAGAGQRST